MDKQTIETIGSHVIAAKVFEMTEGAAVAVPNDHSLQSLELYNATRDRFRGYLMTSSLEDWFAYVNANSNTDTSTVFVNKDDMTAKAILDLGSDETPLHCQHTAKLSAESTPIFNAANHVHESKFSQEQTVEWLEDWGEHLTVIDKNDEEMTLSEAVAAIRRIEVNKKSNADFESGESHAKLSRSEQIEAKSKGRQVHSLRLTCIPYEGLEPVQVEIRLIVLSSETPTIRFRVLRGTEIREAIAQDFKAKIKENIKDIPVYVGSFSSAS